jgi:hypothetical protein
VARRFRELIGKADTGKVRKINVGAAPMDQALAPYDPALADRITGGPWPFDYARWDKADGKARARMVADHLLKALLEIAAAHGWDPAPFRRAHADLTGAPAGAGEAAPKPSAPPKAKAAAKGGPKADSMPEDRFWDLIALLDWDEAGDDDAVLEPLVARLAAGDEKDIFAFDDTLSGKLSALDGEAWARAIGKFAYKDGGKKFSPDLFLYARCAAVIAGRAAYEAALADPARMPKDKEFEAILDAARLAFERKTGGTYRHVPAHDYETFGNAQGWPGKA